MNRALFLVLAAVAIVCVAAVTAQAAVIPMVYNDSTSTVLMDWDMEGAGTPAVGSATFYVAPGSPAGTATGVVVGGGSEPAAYEGSQMLKSYRPGVGTTGAHLDFGSLPGASDTITTTMAFRNEDVNAYSAIYPGTDGTLGNMGGFAFNGTGVIQYHDGGWINLTATHNIGAWNELVLTHTNGTGNWTVTVNNGAPESFTMTDGANWPAYLGILGGFDFYNGFYPSAVYLDAVPVPEPSSLALLGAGLIGLLAYAWRKRK